jgi:hypothetical protein
LRCILRGVGAWVEDDSINIWQVPVLPWLDGTNEVDDFHITTKSA